MWVLPASEENDRDPISRSWQWGASHLLHASPVSPVSPADAERASLRGPRLRRQTLRYPPSPMRSYQGIPNPGRMALPHRRTGWAFQITPKPRNRRPLGLGRPGTLERTSHTNDCQLSIALVGSGLSLFLLLAEPHQLPTDFQPQAGPGTPVT